MKGRLFEGYIDLRGGSMMNFVGGEDCWERVPSLRSDVLCWRRGLLGKSPKFEE